MAYIIIPITAGDEILITCGASQGRIAILTSYTTPIAGESPDFSIDSDFDRIKKPSSNTTTKYICPSDGAYLYVRTKQNNNSAFTPTNIIINGLDYVNSICNNIKRITTYQNEEISDLYNKISRQSGLPNYAYDEMQNVIASVREKMSLGIPAVFGFNTDQHVRIGAASE